MSWTKSLLERLKNGEDSFTCIEADMREMLDMLPIELPDGEIYDGLEFWENVLDVIVKIEMEIKGKKAERISD